MGHVAFGFKAFCVVVLAGCAGEFAYAQQQPASGLYTCRDAHGRTLTSDRPIPECVDREQLELRRTGGVLRNIGPTYTALELEARGERERKAEFNASRQAEEHRRERALLVRYPNAVLHDIERARALAQVEDVTRVARKHLAELMEERNKLGAELEFYKGDANRAPEAVRRAINENRQSIQAQMRFIDEQDIERQRLVGRFDRERLLLAPMWSSAAASAR